MSANEFALFIGLVLPYCVNKSYTIRFLLTVFFIEVIKRRFYIFFSTILNFAVTYHCNIKECVHNIYFF
jgi:hypothetical protein